MVLSLYEDKHIGRFVYISVPLSNMKKVGIFFRSDYAIVFSYCLIFQKSFSSINHVQTSKLLA